MREERGIGGGGDTGHSIALDSAGRIAVAGETTSTDFPVTAGAYDTTLNGTKDDVFIVKISEPTATPTPTPTPTPTNTPTPTATATPTFTPTATPTATPQPSMSPSYNWHYEYDGLERLTYACSDWDGATGTCLGDSFNYTYDGAGNLLSFSRWSGSAVETVNFVYNGANQIVCLDGGGNGLCGDADDVAYSYDAYGNLTSDGSKTYTYDAENRLISVSDATNSSSYSYNGDGDRISQTADGVTTAYVIDIATPLTMVLAETTGTETIYYLHGLDLVAQNDGASTEYFAYDGLGSVRQMLESSGSVLFAQVFDPYGNPYASAGTEITNWGFTGEQTDGHGLIFLRARYYEPRQGRFFTRDPFPGLAIHPATLNPYLYALNNPPNYFDPDGHCPTPPPGMGPTICMALFIEPARIEVFPGVLEVHGDNRTFSSNTDPADSRGYIWLQLEDPDSCGFHINPSGYIIPPGGDLAGIWYTEPSQRNSWTISSSPSGSITLSFDLVISGILDWTDAASHINGTITFTLNGNGGVDYSFVRDGFPWAEAYYHDGNGDIRTIFQDPAVFGNPYDLFAIEPNIGFQRRLTFEFLSAINGRPPEMSTGSSSN